MTTPPPDDIMDLLAAHALGVLEPDEIARLSLLLAERPELRADLAELRATADMLPYGLPEATPPPDLRQRALDRATGRAPARAAAKGAGIAGRARAWVGVLGSLAALALVAAVIGWVQFLGAAGNAGQLRAEIATSQSQLDQLRAQISTANKVLASLQSEAGQAALLETNTGQTVFVAKLPPLPPGRVYQLWRIQGSNAPASAGLFTVNQQGFGQADIASAPPLAGDIIAVTNEPVGGSAGPTSNPLISSTVNA